MFLAVEKFRVRGARFVVFVCSLFQVSIGVHMRFKKWIRVGGRNVSIISIIKADILRFSSNFFNLKIRASLRIGAR